MYPSLFIFLIIILNCTCVRAQHYHLSTDNIYKGYAKGIAKDIVVDKWGYLWVASDEGVFRFDGKNSVFFRDEIKGGYAKSFLRDSKDNILVAHDFGLTIIDSRPDTSVFRRVLTGSLEYADTSLHYPKSIYEDKNGNIWIGENSAIDLYTAGSFQKFLFELKDRSFDFYRSFSFTEDEAETLWTMSFHGNLFYFDQEEHAFKELPVEQELVGVSDITYIRKGVFRVAAKNGVFELEISPSTKSVNSRQIPGIINISSSVWVNNEDFYVGTWDHGLYLLKQEKGEESWEKIEGLPFEDIIEIVHDPDNGIWIAGSQDFALLKPAVFKLFPLGDETLPIETLHFWDKKNLMVGIGTEIFTLTQDENDWQLNRVMSPFERVVTSIGRDKNELWLGGVGGEVFSYDLQTRRLSRKEVFPRSTTRIRQILKDRAGNIWIAGNEAAGLGRISPDGKTRFFTNNGLSKSRAILELEDGTLYVSGRDTGFFLSKFHPEKDDFEAIELNLPFDAHTDFSINDMCEGDNQTLFLASSHGLLSYHPLATSEISRLQRINLDKVPTNEPIKAVLQVDKQNLWVSTASGLIIRKNGTSLLFDTNSGLPSNNLSYQGLQVDHDGNVWVGTARGLAQLNHNDDLYSPTPAPIITSVRIGGRDLPLNDRSSLHIPYHSGLELHFQSLSFPVDKVLYQSRIPELDSTWSAPTSDNYSLISDIPAGRYSFELRAQQQAGHSWSNIFSIHFSVNRPWYQKWWGILLIASVFFFGLYFFARLYNINLLKRNERLELIIKARTAEIHTQKNQIIAQIEQNRQLKEEQLNSEIAYKNKKLTTYTLHLIQKNEALKDLRQKLITHIRNSKRKNLYAELQPVLAQIDESIRQDKEWENFKLYFESVHSGFFEEIKKEYPALTPMELRHCALIRLNLSLQESATILGISSDSVKTARFRLRKKMELPSQPALVSKIMEA